MANRKSAFSSFVAFLIVISLLLAVLRPLLFLLVSEAFVAFVLIMTIGLGVLMIYGIGLIFNVWTESRNSPEVEAQAQIDRLAEQCCERVLAFLSLAHSILAEPTRLVSTRELVTLEEMSNGVLALTDHPPEVFLYALGAVYHRARRFNKAIEYLEQFHSIRDYPDAEAESFGARVGPKLSADVVERAFEGRLTELSWRGQGISLEYLATDYFQREAANSMALLADARRQLYGSLLETITDFPVQAGSSGELSQSSSSTSETELEISAETLDSTDDAPGIDQGRSPIREILYQVYDSSGASDGE